MTPLDDTQRRLHTEVATTLKHIEASWDAIVRNDLKEAEDFLDQAGESLRKAQAIKDNKVIPIPIRGPKGPGM